MIRTILIFLIVFEWACQSSTTATLPQKKPQQKIATTSSDIPFDSSITTIHLYVALCDNRYQGIVPVPAAIGNGQSPNSNLYWGCGYGIKSFFKKSSKWKLIKQYAVDSLVLERLVFKHNRHNAYLIADAYNGKYIKKCTEDFLKSCAGAKKDTIQVPQPIGSAGNAKLLAYVGHDGLMDFKLKETFPNQDGRQRDAIMLACYSRNFFGPHLQATKATPLVWTTGLMCPEAYTLHDALETYLNNQPAEEVRNSAAAAYAHYQKCSMKAAKGLLVSGWK